MAQSLHLIHRGRKLRGDKSPRRQRRDRTLAQVRAAIRLPYKPDHISEAEIRAGVRALIAREALERHT